MTEFRILFNFIFCYQRRVLVTLDQSLRTQIYGRLVTKRKQIILIAYIYTYIRCFKQYKQWLKKNYGQGRTIIYLKLHVGLFQNR